MMARSNAPTSQIGVAYFRVSTKRQGESGLGLEAQRAAINTYIISSGVELIGEYVEIESARRHQRHQLLLALEHCKSAKALLLIAKMDRLARNVHFITSLMEAGVRFVAVDIPEADK